MIQSLRAPAGRGFGKACGQAERKGYLTPRAQLKAYRLILAEG